jgi:hypothetical protein
MLNNLLVFWCPAFYVCVSVVLVGVMVIVLAIGSKVRGLKPGRQRLISKAINIPSKTSFGDGAKPSAPCRKILRHVKDPFKYDRYIDRQNSAAIYCPVSPRFATRCLLKPEQGALVDGSEIIRTQMGSTTDQKMVAVVCDAWYDTTLLQ